MESTEAAPLRIAELTRHRERVAASELLARVWRVPPAESPLPADLITALGRAGGCVLGASTSDGTLVGVTVGFAGAPGSDRVYSYIAGVDASAAGRGVGRQLKLAQRDWALERGAAVLTWTYDPLIRRNAHFNLNRLGAGVTRFIKNYYPPMLDPVNAGDRPDRFVVEWVLSEEPVGRPLPADAATSPVVLAAEADLEPAMRLAEVDTAALGTVRAWVPPDIEWLRMSHPKLGRRWRRAGRKVFRALFADGFRPVGVDADGHYVFVREASSS